MRDPVLVQGLLRKFNYINFSSCILGSLLILKYHPFFFNASQGPKLRLPGRQCDQKFSSGDQNFVVGRQLATGKAGCHCRLSRSEKMIKN